MPQEDLNIVMKAGDILKKKDFEESFKKVLEVVLRREKALEKAVAQLQSTYNALIDRLGKEHSTSLQDLKGKVNDLFVKGRLDEMDAGQKKQFSSLKDGVLKELSGKLNSINVEIKKNAKPGPQGRPGEPGRPPTAQELRLALEPMKEEFQKIWEEKIQRIGRGRVIAGPSANAVQVHEFAGDGTRSYTVPRHRTALLLIGTQAPFIYRSGTSNDFTTANTTLTISSNLDALVAGQNFSFLYIK